MAARRREVETTKLSKAVTIGALLGAAILAVWWMNCGRCDIHVLDDFEKKDVSSQIAAYSRATEGHCFLEGSIRNYLEDIGDHGSASVSAVTPYLDRTEGDGFTRWDALIVLNHAADKGTDISQVLPKLRVIAASADDKYERELATLAIASAKRGPRHPPPSN